MGESWRRIITREDWEEVLKTVDIRKPDMNKLVMNFLATHCFEDAVTNFIKESDTKYINLHKMQVRASILRELLFGNLRTAWLSMLDQYFQICCENPLMTFQMQQQMVIEHILLGEVEQALDICQDFLAPMAVIYPDLQERVEKTYCLLAFENPCDCPLRELVNDSQFTKTANMVNQTLLTGEDQEKDPHGFPLRELTNEPHLMKTAPVVNQALLTGEDQQKEPKLYNVLREMLLVQKQLNVFSAYPQMNISTGILEDPSFETRNNLPCERGRSVDVILHK